MVTTALSTWARRANLRRSTRRRAKIRCRRFQQCLGRFRRAERAELTFRKFRRDNVFWFCGNWARQRPDWSRFRENAGGRNETISYGYRSNCCGGRACARELGCVRAGQEMVSIRRRRAQSALRHGEPGEGSDVLATR